MQANRRSLIERGKRLGSFTLQAVVQEYVTLVLMVEGGREIPQGQTSQYSSEYGLSQEACRSICAADALYSSMFMWNPFGAIT